MAMRPCDRCLENRWKYAVEEGVVTATCQSCAHEVQFPARRKPQRPIRPEKLLPVAVPSNAVVDPDFVDDGLPPWE
jgi:hypothetical protein